MIVRDKGLIVQHDKLISDYRDGGDSSRSTGIMALFGSTKDIEMIFYHWISDGFVRNPDQRHCSNPDDFSRDQLIPLIAGMKRSNVARIVRYEFWRRRYWFGLCPNGDFLGPEFYLHMILCGKVWPLYWLVPILYPFQVIHILWMTRVMPDHEQNQTICLAKISGLLWLWKWLHPDWKKSLRDYWGGWRDQMEIAEFIINGIEKKL